MALGYTLHSIIRSKKELPIGTVIEFSDKDYDDLIKLGAVRAPTDAELKLHGLHTGDGGAETKVTKKPGRKAAQDDGTKAEGSGDGDKDPEVVAGDLDI